MLYGVPAPFAARDGRVADPGQRRCDGPPAALLTNHPGYRSVPTVLIAGLAVLALYLGKRLLVARAEAAQLRTQVAYLKRRLSNAGN